jgi:hypothetical protein
MGLKPEHGRRFIALLRDYMLLQAEIRALSSVLRLVEHEKLVPQGWTKERLEVLRQQPEYRNISEQYEPLFLQAEESADLSEAANLLDKLPSARIQN